LRERLEDVRLVVRFLIDKFAGRIGKRVEGISDECLRLLQSYRWPGNVRELENVVERAIIFTDGPTIEIDAEMLPGVSRVLRGVLRPTKAPVSGRARQHIVSVLEQAHWVIQGPSGAAQILGMHPSTLRYRMKKLDIVPHRH
jgi:formate hydrogenlyase transcriptional activator